MDTNGTKQYEIVYIVRGNGLLIGTIKAFSFDDIWKLKNISPLLSDGDVLRCFSELGSVDTYRLEIKVTSDWPPVLGITEIPLLNPN
ncbi:MAG: hypothetical protein K9L66_13165 [Spirochaetaceae bacterium]|nr:hypothetical protein [Spirochaetaceae bacterium]